ncbi:MAG: RnfABCDGE type electron transport complex subunit D [Clostridia bacterium]|nr:RnfABCDGE type electron transport complex subunit D [Clostridia bacterium]
MSSLLNVSSSPHIRQSDNTTGIMLDVLISLLPATVFGIVLFGYRAAILIAVCVASCLVFEFLARKLFKNQGSLLDLSAAVTGLLIALNLPPRFPVWMAIIGCFAAIVVVKQMFGGLGHNFVNPAIAARIILLISFPTHMTTYHEPFNTDAITTATPLGMEECYLSVKELLFGLHGGSIGETSVIMLAIGGIYLIIRRVISPTIPLSFIGSVGVLTLILSGNLSDAIFAMLTGGVFLGAIFMATDYVTSPTTTLGKIIFGIGCGVITVIIRSGAAAEGVSFAIIFMNLLVPHIDGITVRKPFGWEAKKQ